MYFETNRPQQREWDREERERYAEAVDAAEIPRRSLVDRALSVAYAAPDWFMSVIFPRVMAGATMGAIAGLIITLPPLGARRHQLTGAVHRDTYRRCHERLPELQRRWVRPRKARSVIEGAITAQPLQARFYPVLLADGEWWAYRDLDVKLERVYCPAHHAIAVRIEGGDGIGPVGS